MAARATAAASAQPVAATGGASAGAPSPRPLVRRALDALDDSGIAWALLRGAEALSGPSGDIDILVERAAVPRIDAVLLDAGFTHIAARGYGTHRFYVSYDAADDRWLELDVVVDVAFGSHQQFRSAVAPALLARRERREAVSVLNSNDAFWHLALHLLLSRGGVPAHRRDVLRASAPSAREAGPLQALVHALRPRVVSLLPAAVEASDWGAVAQLGRELRVAWYLRDGRDVAVRSALHRLQRHVPAGGGRRGMSVAVLGPDGAGKTTLANALLDSTRLPAAYVYLGVWRASRFERQLRRILGARLAVRLTTLLSRRVVIAYQRRRGRLVVLDRYTVDADLPSDELDAKGRISAKLVRRTNAEPDVMILLDAPAELMYARKREQGVAELQRRRETYLAMVERFPQMVVIDAQQPPTEVRRQATELIWGMWSQRE